MSFGFTHQETPIGLRVAQAVGLTASAYLFGQNASLSYLTVPVIMQASAPEVAVKQWEKAYDIGKTISPPLAILAALSTGYVAYHQDPSSLAFKLNVAATVLLPSIIPITFAFIVPTNNELYKKRNELAAVATTAAELKAAEVGVAGPKTVHGLLDKWATLNLARALVTGVGSALATWAAVS